MEVVGLRGEKITCHRLLPFADYLRSGQRASVEISHLSKASSTHRINAMSCGEQSLALTLTFRRYRPYGIGTPFMA